MAGRALLIAGLLAAALGLLRPSAGAEATGLAFPGWPTHFEGRALRRVALSERERELHAHFPGEIARFAAGDDQLVLRWLRAPSRQLHPARLCFEGLGYATRALPEAPDERGRMWGRFEAVRGAERQVVRERVEDAQGQSFASVSRWYWQALLGRTHPPYRAVLHARPLGID